jgi:methylated-DNA-[protein]-cysteine S-methyltransferase
VLAANGRSGGFSAPGGTATKLKLLRIENARRGAQPGLFDE